MQCCSINAAQQNLWSFAFMYKGHNYIPIKHLCKLSVVPACCCCYNVHWYVTLISLIGVSNYSYWMSYIGYAYFSCFNNLVQPVQNPCIIRFTPACTLILCCDMHGFFCVSYIAGSPWGLYTHCHIHLIFFTAYTTLFQLTLQWQGCT